MNEKEKIIDLTKVRVVAAHFADIATAEAWMPSWVQFVSPSPDSGLLYGFESEVECEAWFKVYKKVA